MDYRKLTDEEINVLEDHNCWAEDWSRVSVADDFRPNYMHRVMLYGDVRIGVFEKNEAFPKKPGAKANTQTKKRKK